MCAAGAVHSAVCARQSGRVRAAKRCTSHQSAHPLFTISFLRRVKAAQVAASWRSTTGGPCAPSIIDGLLPAGPQGRHPGVLWEVPILWFNVVQIIRTSYKRHLEPTPKIPDGSLSPRDCGKRKQALEGSLWRAPGRHSVETDAGASERDARSSAKPTTPQTQTKLKGLARTRVFCLSLRASRRSCSEA